MNIGMIGMGKLGLPVSVALGHKGYLVYGHDKNPDVINWIRDPDSYPYIEKGIDPLSFPEMLACHRPIMTNLANIASECEIIFLAVQTPHDPKYDGTHRIPEDRKDFDYQYLKAAVSELAPYLTIRHTVVIISTVMPGTIRREIKPIIDERFAAEPARCKLVYNPFFIAMGTVIPDFLYPEFVLIGIDENAVNSYPVSLVDLYREIYSQYQQDIYHQTAPGSIVKDILCIYSYESAELTKVAYNTFIGFKIALANTFGQLADRVDQADADDVMEALCKADDRLISAKYLKPGMGDGGACHPRDLIAMSWLQNKYNLRCNPFDDVMRWRESHAEYLAMRMISLSIENQLPLAIYGLAFKKNTAMLDGSHAVLVDRILESQRQPAKAYDPIARIGNPVDDPHVILIGINHAQFRMIDYPAGSVILDPWRMMPEKPGCKILRIGAGSNPLHDAEYTPPSISNYEKGKINFS